MTKSKKTIESATTVASIETIVAASAAKIERSASDKIALKIVDKIREDRSAFIEGQTIVDDKGITTKSFSADLGQAIVFVGQHQQPGKKGREIIARAFITVKPKNGSKELSISGSFTARAWFALTHQPKGAHVKAEPDAEALASAAEALGL
jgi:hypothetical protein